MQPLIFLLASTFLFLNNWTEVTNIEGRFKVQVPGEMTEKMDTLTTSVGTMAYHTFFYQTNEKEADNLFYMVTYYDYPEGVELVDSTGSSIDFFESTMESAAESVDGDLIYSTDIQLDTHPGKFWRIDYLDKKAVIKTKAYIVGRRYYALQTISYQTKNINSSSERFFDSFKLL